MSLPIKHYVHFISLLIGTTFFTHSISVQAQRDWTELLIRKNTKARGGAEAMSRVRNVKIDQEITQSGATTKSVYYAENNDKFRFEQSLNNNASMIMITNGKEGWMTMGKSWNAIGPKDAGYASEADGNPLGPLFQAKERGYRIKYLGKDTLQNRTMQKLKVEMNAMQQVIYLDAKTFLERKIERGVMNFGKESGYVMWLEDYKPVDGVLFPP